MGDLYPRLEGKMGSDMSASEVGGLLVESVNHVRDLRASNDYLPKPGSRFLKDFEASESDDCDPFDSFGFLAYDLAAAQIAAAEDHIHALGRMLVETSASVSPYVLGRAAIEAAARAVHILNPALSDRERAALVVAERLNELRQVRRLMVAHDPQESTPRVLYDIREGDRSMSMLKEFAQDHGVVIPTRPGFTVVIEELLGSGESGLYATVAVAAYSAVAHAVPDMLLAHAVDGPDDEFGPFKIGLAKIGDGFQIDLVVAVLLAYTRCMQVQIDAYGWDGSAWKEWLAYVRKSLLTVANELEPQLPDTETKESDEYEIPWSPALEALLEGQLAEFRREFGRDPTEEEPIFFEPGSPEPIPVQASEEELMAQLLEVVEALGQLSPAREYAIKKCRFVASTYAWPFLPADRRREWEEAIIEYYVVEGLAIPEVEQELVELPDPDYLIP